MIIKKTKYQRVGNDYMKVNPLDDFAAEPLADVRTWRESRERLYVSARPQQEASQNFIMQFSGKVFG